MSRFSLVGGNDTTKSLSRFSMTGNTKDESSKKSRSRHSLPDLNRRLLQETKGEQHIFFGPQHTISRKPRVLHSQRKIEMNSKRVWFSSEPMSLSKDGVERASTTSVDLNTGTNTPSAASRIGSRLSAAGKFLGRKVVDLAGSGASTVNDDSFCDGCGMSPIIGNLWSCYTCSNYHLCNACYEDGIHGFEDSLLLKSLRTDFAIKAMMDMSKHKIPRELFDILMKEVCRNQLDRFKFFSNWIVTVFLGYSLNKIKFRGIEIPNLTQKTRTSFVALLTPVLAERSDLDVNMEWVVQETDVKDKHDTSSTHLETLRVWISTETENYSPFISKDKTDESRSPHDSDQLPIAVDHLVSPRHDSTVSTPDSNPDEELEQTPPIGEYSTEVNEVQISSTLTPNSDMHDSVKVSNEEEKKNSNSLTPTTGSTDDFTEDSIGDEEFINTKTNTTESFNEITENLVGTPTSVDNEMDALQTPVSDSDSDDQILHTPSPQTETNILCTPPTVSKADLLGTPPSAPMLTTPPSSTFSI